MLTTVVLFNGPPGSGKDSVADELNCGYDMFFSASQKLEFKSELYKKVGDLFSLDPAIVQAINSCRELKEVPCSLFRLYSGGDNLSCRDALIHTSENAIKPLFGNNFFANELAKKIKPGVNLISDCGFREEVEVLSRLVGPENVLVVRLHRPGFTFSSDSRRHVNPDDVSEPLVPTFIEVMNDSSDVGSFTKFTAGLVLKWHSERLVSFYKSGGV